MTIGPSQSVDFTALRGKTLPGVLCERARETPEAVAYRAKVLGVYRERTWREFRKTVSIFALGIQAMGLSPGERVAIMGDVCEEWTVCDMGAQAAGAITYGIYPTASAAEVEYQMTNGGASVFVAENQEYVDKILPLLDRLPQVRHVVVVETKAMFMYDHPKLIPYVEVLAKGKSIPDGEKEFETMVTRVLPQDPAFIVYTSGTTGHPKGALVSHGKHLAAVATFLDRYPGLIRVGHRTVAYLPLCHIMGRDIAMTLPLISGIVPHYGESLADLPETMFEVAPTVMMFVPRYLQKYASQILVGIESSTRLKRLVYLAARWIGRRRLQARWEARFTPLLMLANKIGQCLVFRPLLNRIGFLRLEYALCGGAPLPREVATLWQMHGVNLGEIYGQTETGGAMISAQSQQFPRPGDVGLPPRGWEIRLDDQGEIWVRGADLFEGFWEDEKATCEVFGEDGWLRTGDIGEWTESGQLRLVDRAKDFIITSGGKSLSPTFIENLLRSSPYISEAVVLGEGRKYLTALVEIEYETVTEWARTQGLTYTGFTNLTENPAVLEMIEEEVGQANTQLARVEQIKAVRLLPREFDPEDESEPITPTRKIKRGMFFEKYRDLVESMYEDGEERRVAGAVGDLVPPTTAPQPETGN